MFKYEKSSQKKIEIILRLTNIEINNIVLCLHLNINEKMRYITISNSLKENNDYL